MSALVQLTMGRPGFWEAGIRIGRTDLCCWSGRAEPEEPRFYCRMFTVPRGIRYASGRALEVRLGPVVLRLDHGRQFARTGQILNDWEARGLIVKVL